MRSGQGLHTGKQMAAALAHGLGRQGYADAGLSFVALNLTEDKNPNTIASTKL